MNQALTHAIGLSALTGAAASKAIAHTDGTGVILSSGARV